MHKDYNVWNSESWAWRTIQKSDIFFQNNQVYALRLQKMIKPTYTGDKINVISLKTW